jgi:hypothetical protein
MKSFALVVVSLTVVGIANANSLVTAQHGRHGQTAMAKKNILVETQAQNSSTQSDSARAQLKADSAIETSDRSGDVRNGQDGVGLSTGRHGQSLMAQRSILK